MILTVLGACLVALAIYLYGFRCGALAQHTHELSERNNPNPADAGKAGAHEPQRVDWH